MNPPGLYLARMKCHHSPLGSISSFHVRSNALLGPDAAAGAQLQRSNVVMRYIPVPSIGIITVLLWAHVCLTVLLGSFGAKGSASSRPASSHEEGRRSGGFPCAGAEGDHGGLGPGALLAIHRGPKTSQTKGSYLLALRPKIRRSHGL